MKRLKSHGCINNSRQVLYKRSLAFFLDLLICSLIAFVFVVVLSCANPKQNNMINIMISDLLLISAFFCKDIVRPSFGKRIMKLNIYTIQGKTDIKTSKLIFRNLAMVIWPIEVYFLCKSNGEQRFVDKKMGLIVKEK